MILPKDICACLGPANGEPFCMCVMIQNGLKKSEDYDWSQEEKDKLSSVLGKIFNWEQDNERD